MYICGSGIRGTTLVYRKAVFHHWFHMMDTKQSVLLELEESLCNNTTLHELAITLCSCIPNTISIGIINCVIKGVIKNKSIQSFSLHCDRKHVLGMGTETQLKIKSLRIY